MRLVCVMKTCTDLRMSQDYIDQEKLKAMQLKLSFLVHDLRTYKYDPEAQNSSLHHIGNRGTRNYSGCVSSFIQKFQARGTFLDDKMQEIIQNRRLKRKDGGAKHDSV